ncbi:MAG: NapC/NirT family cytochrome c [Bryobacteraceae bacterium]
MLPNKLSSLVYLSNNWLSLTGVVMVTTATVFWLFLLPITLRGQATHPYIGILIFLILPMVFFAGLALIPLGIALHIRRERRSGITHATFPPLNWQNRDFRRLLLFVGVTTFLNIVIGSQLTYGAVNYMDTVTFCGRTCHTVMQPEYTAHQNSPHARVACVDCHIGPGASWFVRSKLSGTSQVFHTLLDDYPRPIPSPVQNLRPARETCEVCHWPQRFDADRLRVIRQYGDDEHNALTYTVLMVKIGGGSGGQGIHGMHVGEGVHIRYAYSDEKRQTIPWVEYTDRQGRSTVFRAADAKTPLPGNLPVRDMDCVDCHNRPTHAFQLPDHAMDEAMASGAISPSLPFIKKQGGAVLRQDYASQEAAAQRIPAAIDAFYRQNYPDVYRQRQPAIAQAGAAIYQIYQRNVFPGMRVTWGTYSDNIGHTDFPGCFRCHDGNHVAAGGRTVTQDCGACHDLLAVQDPAPKVLGDLGLAGPAQ